MFIVVLQEYIIMPSAAVITRKVHGNQASDLYLGTQKFLSQR